MQSYDYVVVVVMYSKGTSPIGDWNVGDSSEILNTDLEKLAWIGYKQARVYLHSIIISTLLLFYY